MKSKHFFTDRDKFMLQMLSNNLDLLIVLAVHLLKRNKEFENLCGKKIQTIFIKMIWIKLVFSMIWLMVNVDLSKLSSVVNDVFKKGYI